MNKVNNKKFEPSKPKLNFNQIRVEKHKNQYKTQSEYIHPNLWDKLRPIIHPFFS